ncbi:MAG: DUF4037 domain-containing protein [Ruminococcaceae bacterium]|nr:DUF4037 domain-containing protein [Oscillospiraceae bacterium]
MFDALIKEFAALDGVEAIALGGSRATQQGDTASDYDVYVYCTEPIDVAVRRGILQNYCAVLEIDNRFWEQEDNATLKNGIDIDIIYRDLDAMIADVASVVEQFQARNGYTTCMWHNLKNCTVLYDREGRLSQAKARFDVAYPEELMENIVSRNYRLLHAALPAYRMQIAKALKRQDVVSLNHRVAAFMESYFDILFAVNGQTHPGEKRLIQRCKACCENLPEDFEENINRLFYHMYTAPQEVNGDIARIVGQLQRIL